MASPQRRRQVRRERKATYHCTARCVRRAFLCGRDAVTGKDYSHRKGWLLTRHEQLAGLFAIEVEFRSELSNHLHAVARTRPDVAARWSDRQVAWRWLTAMRLAKWMDDSLPPVDTRRVEALLQDKERLKEVRGRLSDISWYMAVLLENIARRINREEGEKGQVWDSPFRCREIADVGSLLICGMYVDLNENRAGEAVSLETARHTSIFQRLMAADQEPFSPERVDAYLAELTLRPESKADWEWAYKSRTGKRASDLGCLPISLADYELLLRWTLEMLQSGRRKKIPRNVFGILEKLKLNPEYWVEAVASYDTSFCRVVGPPEAIREVAARMGARHLKGMTAARQVFTSCSADPDQDPRPS